MANSLALYTLIPLLGLQLDFDRIHQLTIMGSSSIAQVSALDNGKLSCMLCQVNHLLQLALAECTLAM
ncbi:hypothetical protein D3C86_1543190 [compost metagenome]